MPPLSLRQPETIEGGNSTPPLHVAIIMDGNRRWARAHGKLPIFGHRQGAETVRRTIESCCEIGIRYLTLFAFSSENWLRPAGEVFELMNLLRFYLRKEIEALHKNGVRVRVIGDRTRLDTDICQLIERAERKTIGNQRLDLIIALNYGARSEIVEAARALARQAARGEIDPEAIDEPLFDRALSTNGIPDPDLLIRTSGEQRVSNFLLWQLAYTEFVFVDAPWPDFGREDFHAALAQYNLRERRYGASVG